MNSNEREHPPKENPNKKDDDTPQEQVPGVEKKLFIRRVILYSFLWALLIALWQGLPTFGHDLVPLSLLCFLLSWIVGPLGLRQSLRNYSATKRNANSSTIPMLIGGIGLSGFLVWHEYRTSPPQTDKQAPPHPQFTFAAMMNENPDAIVRLTNDFLLATNHAWAPVRGYVLVPMPALQSNLVFTVVVKNDSAIPADEVLASVSLPKELDVVPGYGWDLWDSDTVLTREVRGVIKTNLLKGFAYRFREQLSAHNGGSTPPLLIRNPPSDFGPFQLMARSKGSDPQFANFFLWLFPAVTNWGLTNPFRPFAVAPATNASGAVDLSLSREQMERLQK